MIEYIVEKKQTSGGWTWAEQKGKLIRCKDCIHYTGKWCTKYSSKEIDLNDVCKSDNDYCSRAERKEE